MTLNLLILLAALHAVENPLNVRVGITGDLGPYQMSAAARADGLSPEERLRWLARQLPLHGLPVNEYTLAMAWHAPERTFRGTFTNGDADYADRARNTYNRLAKGKQ
jgi:hypothetical protein